MCKQENRTIIQIWYPHAWVCRETRKTGKHTEPGTPYTSESPRPWVFGKAGKTGKHEDNT
jgi:hypothetical protein